MLKLLPSNTKFSRYGKTPKDPLKCAETEGQRALTSELLSIGLKKIKKIKKKDKVLERPKTQKRKRKIRNFYKVICLKNKKKSSTRKRPYLKSARKREQNVEIHSNNGNTRIVMATQKARSKKESEK